MKLDRLQLRIEGQLKEWFEKYARNKGGMSLLVRNFVIDLQDKEEDQDGRQDEERTRG